MLLGNSSTSAITNNGGTSDLVYTVASDNAALLLQQGGTVEWLGSDELTVTYTPTAASADTEI